MRTYSTILIYFTILISIQTVYAQKTEECQYRCHYLYQYASLESDLTRPEGLRFLRVVLDIGAQSSFYYFRTGYLAQLYCDSLQNKGFSWEEAADKAVLRFGYNGEHANRIYKNYPRKGQLRQIKTLGETFYYDEPLEKPQWKIMTEKKQIEGYTCEQATCSFRGRNWTAWYTTAIPISDGPWKLWGLPGLILEAYETENCFHFTFRGIEKINKESPLQLTKRDWIRTNQKQIKELEALRQSDFRAYIRQVFGTEFTVIGKDGKLEKENRNKPKYILIEK